MSVTQSSTLHPSVRESSGTVSGHVRIGSRDVMGNHLLSRTRARKGLLSRGLSVFVHLRHLRSVRRITRVASRTLKLNTRPAARALGGQQFRHAGHDRGEELRRESALVKVATHSLCDIERSSPIARDRKSTRLNSSHVATSYAVFCLKKKKKLLTLPHTTLTLV